MDYPKFVYQTRRNNPFVYKGLNIPSETLKCMYIEICLNMYVLVNVRIGIEF